MSLKSSRGLSFGDVVEALKFTDFALEMGRFLMVLAFYKSTRLPERVTWSPNYSVSPQLTV